MGFFCYDIAMIRELSGSVSHITPTGVVVKVGGIGLFVRLLPEVVRDLSVGEQVSFHTYLAVRENALDLFGFLEEEELAFFELLIGIPGIGPKSAINILAAAPPATLKKSVLSGNVGYLTKVSGIGRKTAEKIALELKDAISKMPAVEGALSGDDDALEALVSLGYPRQMAREALRQIPEEITDASARITEALKRLSNR